MNNMTNMNPTTRVFARVSKQPEHYLTVEGPHKADSGVPTLAAIATVLCVVAVFVWGWL